MKLTPARVASLLAGAGTLCAALAPAIANLDTTSTAGALGGAVVLLGILDRFLVGQRAYEARVAANPPPPIYATTTSSAGAGSFTLTTPPFATGGTPPPVDDGEDGDDQLPAELDEHPVDENPPPDEVDLPHGKVQP